jgi:prepilin-type N-terminal cleavage/methylation domain-containing protein
LGLSVSFIEKDTAMNKAFTLIEIIIVTAILGILAAIAMPKFSAALERSIVSEGVTAVATLHGGMERYNLQNGFYPADCALLDVDIVPKSFGTLSCANTGTVSVSRSTGKYMITQTQAGVFSCTDLVGSTCAYLKLPN